MIEFFIALTLPDSGNVSGFALRRLAFLSVVREIVDLTLTFLSSLVKNDRVSLQKSIQLIRFHLSCRYELVCTVNRAGVWRTPDGGASPEYG